MGIRETLNKNPAITTGGTIGIILLAIIFIVWELMPARPPKISTKVYFADNDGADYANYYAYDASKTPPFTDDKHTKAVRCFVYSCKGGKPFVAFMEKYSKEALAQMFDASGKRTMRPGEMRDMPGHLVKKPGGEWLDMVEDKEEAMEVMHVKCPDGSTDNLQVVTPP